MKSPDDATVKTMLVLSALACAAWARPVSLDRPAMLAQSRGEDRPAAPHAEPDQPPDNPSDHGDLPDRPSMRRAQRGEQSQDGRRAQPLWDRLDDEGRRRLRAFVQEHFPEMFAEIEWLEVNRPRQAVNRLRRLAPEMARFRELMRRDPEQARLAIQERRLDLQIIVRVRDYWASNNDIDRAELRAEIVDLTERLFDVRLQRRKLEVDQLRDRITGLERRLEHAEKNRATIIERQIAEKLDRRPRPNRRPGSDRRRDDPHESDEP